MPQELRSPGAVCDKWAQIRLCSPYIDYLKRGQREKGEKCGEREGIEIVGTKGENSIPILPSQAQTFVRLLIIFMDFFSDMTKVMVNDLNTWFLVDLLRFENSSW